MRSQPATIASLLVAVAAAPSHARAEESLFRTVDLDVGEAADVQLGDGKSARVKLIAAVEIRDRTPQRAIRRVQVTVDVNGASGQLEAGLYNLPVSIGGVQIDSPVTRNILDYGLPGFALTNSARLRLWPAASPWMPPGSFVYPLLQRWLVSDTQYSNEIIEGGALATPGGDATTPAYHSGLDMGGIEGMIQVVAATAGTVVRVHGQTSALLGTDHPLSMVPDEAMRPDVIYVRDARNWYYRYSHLQRAEDTLALEQEVKAGDRLGLLGKEGASGGWSHLHFEMYGKQPSGKWGTIGAYPFAWEAYVRQYSPAILAVARPRQLVVVGDTLVLDGRRSWSASGPIRRFEWSLTDGTRREGAQVSVSYATPGTYSELLTVEDEAGHVARDYTVVRAVGRTWIMPPWTHIVYAPTFASRPGDPVKPGTEITFRARTFDSDRRIEGEDEHWSFGDGTPEATSRSKLVVDYESSIDPDGYALIRHTFARAGSYVVRVERKNPATGWKAIARIPIEIGDERLVDAGADMGRQPGSETGRDGGNGGAGSEDGRDPPGAESAAAGDVTGARGGCGCRVGSGPASPRGGLSGGQAGAIIAFGLFVLLAFTRAAKPPPPDRTDRHRQSS